MNNNELIIKRLEDLNTDLNKFNEEYYESEGSEAVHEYIEDKIRYIEETIKICKNTN